MKIFKNNRLIILGFSILSMTPMIISAQVGCTDINACNYDPNAVTDDGTCSFFIDCAGVCGGNYVLDFCGNCYDPNGANGEIQFNYTGAIQNWIVPEGVNNVTIEAYGAEGGVNSFCFPYPGGKGARMKGDFNVVPGQTLNIVVGQRGINSIGGNDANNGSSGGGGSFVWVQGDSSPLLVAGGGGGGAICSSGGNPASAPGLDAVVGTSGTADRSNVAPGGINGNNGTNQGGGKGWLTVISNPAGDNSASPNGGYGGGGAVSGQHSGGGGGGYSGGGARPYNGLATGGGGGGSYNAGSNQDNAGGVQLGNGLVIITFNAIPDCPAGCTDINACNFDPNATLDDGTCTYPDGCTDINACNFDPAAGCDDGSCTYAACNDPVACNFDPSAGCDDGSCIYLVDCAGVCGGNYVLDACGNCYDPNNVGAEIQFNYTGAIQNWIVPEGINNVTIEAYGAEGGVNSFCFPYPGGKGARMKGDFNVVPGQTLNIVVGQRGINSIGGNDANNGSSGGGGSFVWVQGDSSPLLVAGGGGGGAICSSGGNPASAPGLDAVVGTSGTADRSNAAPGGINGNNGTNQGGGKGWLTVISNPAGDNSASPNGGYGGGGAVSGQHSGGGGGGYSGGGARPYNGLATGGGGGGSYNAGSNQDNAGGVRLGDGLVIINYALTPECNSGCTNPSACNYDESAQIEDGSCILPDGCTDANACNYNPLATCNDGTCEFPGCIDINACNFDPNAACDDGSCAYILDCAGNCGGTYIEDLCGNCYDPNLPVSGNFSFNYTGAIQNWIVPEGVNNVTIEAYGAEGGVNSFCFPYPGGKGARMKGDFNVVPGQTLNIVVGQRGINSIGGNDANNGSSGGGGSFVWVQGDSSPLLVAGGGGGGAICSSGGNPASAPGLDAVVGTSGTADRSNAAPGGINGNNGTNQGGGKGWLTVISNPAGDNSASPNGGYGGGGAVSGQHSGGGGGGYSGGGARPYNGLATGGDGGGSYNAGSNQDNAGGVRLGDGLVIISFDGIPECLSGCTDPVACNYDPIAEVDDSTCTYPDGCTDVNACNFDPAAGCDDGSCTYAACNDPAACNFDPSAGCDDGSCIYLVDCAGVCGGNYVLDACGNCYDPNNVGAEIQFNYTGNIQNWIVPEGVNNVTIEAYGAEGGVNSFCFPYPGGKGARMKGDFNVVPGQTLNIVVGQRGINSVGGNDANNGSSGGGGSFVWVQGDSSPLLVAGGGGGGAICSSGGNPASAPGLDAIVGTSGTADRSNVAPGGINGNNGTNQGGGKGWLTVISNPAGDNSASPNGGYGGGGAVSGQHSGGGGGGYSGGGARPYNGLATGGGGGGSFNAGSNQDNAGGVRLGDGLVIITYSSSPECFPGCDDPLAVNYDPGANFNDGSCIYVGCTNPIADNYNPIANLDDGSCIISGCTYPQALNYDPEANTEDGTCLFDECVTSGCTDNLACNFNINAITEDGSCLYPAPFEDCSGNCINDTDNDGVCDELEIFGCTNWNSINFDPGATEDDGTCIAVIFGCTDPTALNFDSNANTDNGSCILIIAGCMDPHACTFNPTANQDDASCNYDCYGCTYAEATNFDVEATIDDGSCTYPVNCNADITGDGLINTADLISLLAQFGTSCP